MNRFPSPIAPKRRLSVEWLEGRALPGDTLLGLLTSMFGAALLLDVGEGLPEGAERDTGEDARREGPASAVAVVPPDAELAVVTQEGDVAAEGEALAPDGAESQPPVASEADLLAAVGASTARGRAGEGVPDGGRGAVAPAGGAVAQSPHAGLVHSADPGPGSGLRGHADSAALVSAAAAAGQDRPPVRSGPVDHGHEHSPTDDAETHAPVDAEAAGMELSEHDHASHHHDGHDHHHDGHDHHPHHGFGFDPEHGPTDAHEHAAFDLWLREQMLAEGDGHDHQGKSPPSIPGPQGLDPAVVGQWSDPVNWPAVAVHSQMLPTGKVLFWGYSDTPMRLWDPATGQLTTPGGPGYNVFCSAASLMADGRVFVAGGHIQNGDGLPHSSIYDPFTDTWEQLPDMNDGRWYPTTTTLPSGDVLVVSGSFDTNFTNNTLPQVWQVATEDWRNLTTAQRSLPLYPIMYVAPNGRVYNAGPEQSTRFLNTSGTGGWTNGPSSGFGYRDYGSSVVYDEGKVLLVGGGNTPTATAEVIDLTQPTPVWRAVGPLSVPRRQINATVLADGQVLVTGGVFGEGFNNTATPVYTAELWDPATEQWTVMAPMQAPRWYHSTALLLPDGRVMSAGGDGNPTLEVYSPPYLFQGLRPAILSAPDAVAYGESFTIRTTFAKTVERVSLVRLGSVTHTVNFDQRYLGADFAAGPLPRQLTVTAPADANVAPPGYYMMFAVTKQGVPSEAHIVRIGA
jgi:hypothetical protein